MIASLKEAQEILKSDSANMIIMQMDFSCWIVLGIKDSEGILVASKKNIAEISEDVFKALAKQMGQYYCSEYFQIIT